MIKVYYCRNCDRTFYVSTELDTSCRACGTPCMKLKTTYPSYTNLSLSEREAFVKEELIRHEKLQQRRNHKK